MNEVEKTGRIRQKNFSDSNFILIQDSSAPSESYYFYGIDIEKRFPDGTNVNYKLATFTDGNRPIVIDVQ